VSCVEVKRFRICQHFYCTRRQLARWPVCWNTIDMQTHAQVPITEPQALIRMDCVSLVAIYKSCQGKAKLGKNRALSATELQFLCTERVARQTISCNVILLLLHCTRHTTCIPKVVCSSPSDSKDKPFYNFQHCNNLYICCYKCL
jgi:hypothetical protein